METQSRNRLEKLFIDEGWAVSDVRPDYGEDLNVRIFEDGVASPYYFYVQLKATDDIERLRVASNTVAITVPVTTARTWMELAQPLFLILWDAPSDVWYWCHVQTFLQSKQGADRMSRLNKSISIPITNRLAASNLAALAGVVREVTTWSTKAYQSLQMLKGHLGPSKLVIFGTAALAGASAQQSGPEVMIDEIEMGLHPTASRKILDLLNDPKVQVGLRLKDRSGKLLYASEQKGGALLGARKPKASRDRNGAKKAGLRTKRSK